MPKRATMDRKRQGFLLFPFLLSSVASSFPLQTDLNWGVFLCHSGLALPFVVVVGPGLQPPVGG